jgi:hypothetical protein
VAEIDQILIGEIRALSGRLERAAEDNIKAAKLLAMFIAPYEEATDLLTPPPSNDNAGGNEPRDH